MYNSSLKHKWDNKNVRDYEINKGREQGREEGEHKKVVEMAQIVNYTEDTVEIDKVRLTRRRPNLFASLN